MTIISKSKSLAAHALHLSYTRHSMVLTKLPHSRFITVSWIT